MTEQYKKVIRDPIYGYIGFTERQLKVIELPVFQRLRRISQLSFADLVYPNANHNRFSHSLGVMHLARILSDYLKGSGLGEQLNLNDDDYEAIVWAGLLHDVGHLPFSHVSEPAFAFYMDNIEDWKDYHVKKIGDRIIRDSDFGIKDILGKEMATKVCKLIKGENSQIPRVLTEMTTGTCSIDRLDYLKRDAYHAGTPEYAIIDVERIIKSLLLYPQDPYIAPIFRKKALYALEGAVLSYFFMYRAVYYHHTVRSAYLFFEDILWKAFQKYNLKEKLKDVYKLEFWHHFDDHFFLTLLRDTNKNLRNRLEQLIFRKLPKMIPNKKITRENRRRIYRFVGRTPFKDKVQKEEDIKNRLEEYEVEKILLDSPMIIPYPHSLLAEKRIYIWEDNEPTDMTKLSTHLSRLQDAAEEQLAARVYVSPAELRSDEKFIEDLNRAIMMELK